ncbi:copper homeostasis protein CutC [Mesoplasma florum]|uniref:copper homeostasis protein CutC n=1 Tax=Mesoplasma florum TaxID=2151 RepID=UPI00131A43CE|nr:copper homeostasis protein CutC [Mesoplasma florum]
MQNNKVLEVIAADIKDINIINLSNADRIEFCKELKKSGFTPDYEDIEEACKISKLPINVMVRNTDRDFCYTDAEFNQMLEDIKFINKTKANSIVIGILTPDNKIDVKRMKIVKENLNENIKITFHKAFDLVEDKIEAVKLLEDIGISTILTSAGNKIDDNLKLLKQLTNSTKIEILAGGGVNWNNFTNVKECSNSIHIGTLARFNNSWDDSCDIDFINNAKNLLTK